MMKHPIEEAVTVLTKFFYSPWGAAKSVRWEMITNLPFDDKSFANLLRRLVVDKDELLRRHIVSVLTCSER